MGKIENSEEEQECRKKSKTKREEKTMKRAICLTLMMLLVGCTTVFAYADEFNDIGLERAGGSKRLSVTCYQQEQKNSCGPASCRMVLKYFGTSKTEATLRTEMHELPDKDFTHIDSVTSILNKYVSGKPYKKVFNSKEAFADNLMTNIDAGYPVICQVDTRKLPKYGGTSYKHYVVATGYMWGQGGSTGGINTVYYNDPHYMSKYYGTAECTWSEMSEAINGHSGLYVRGR